VMVAACQRRQRNWTGTFSGNELSGKPGAVHLCIIAKDYYGCRARMESGLCSNEIRIHRAAIEQLVVDEIAA